MDGTREHHVKWSKSGSERKRSHIFFHIWSTDPNTNSIFQFPKEELLEEIKGGGKEE
jgi:hypothetical protein